MFILNNIANGRNACLIQYVVLYHFPVVLLNRTGLMAVCRRIVQYHNKFAILCCILLWWHIGIHSLMKSVFFVWPCSCSLRGLFCACPVYCINVGIKHGFSCITIRRRPRFSTPPEGPGEC